MTDEKVLDLHRRIMAQHLEQLDLFYGWHEKAFQADNEQIEKLLHEVFFWMGFEQEKVPEQVGLWLSSRNPEEPMWADFCAFLHWLEEGALDGLCHNASCLGDKEALVALAKALPYVNSDWQKAEKIENCMREIAFQHIANIVRGYVQVAPIYSLNSIYFDLDEGGYIRIAEQPSPAVAAKLIDYPLLEITVGAPHYYTDVYLPIPFSPYAVDELEEELNRELKKYAVPQEIWYEGEI